MALRRRPPPAWSIGIYRGSSPLTLSAAPPAGGPVLTRREVADVPALFVADPFLLRRGGAWYMFFEVMNLAAGKGEIGLATSDRGWRWRYQGRVLAEPYHLSYPFVFRWRSEVYMLPETLGAGCLRLYRAVSFPSVWERAADLLDGPHVDASLIRWRGAWWLWSCTSPRRHDTLRLYMAERLGGPWREHPRSPIVEGDTGCARPAGRVLPWEGGLLRFAQDCRPYYGRKVRAFAIGELSATAYREQEVAESPVLAPGQAGWNASGMHHLDAHRLAPGQWIAAVDGRA